MDTISDIGQSQQLEPLDARAENEVEKLKLKLVKTDFDATSDQKEKRKRQVLEEDDYTSRIASIIEKDFFPDVTKLRFELEYRDAIENNDYDKLQQLGKQKLEDNQRGIPSDTPASFETPMNWQTDFDIIKDCNKR